MNITINGRPGLGILKRIRKIMSDIQAGRSPILDELSKMIKIKLIKQIEEQDTELLPMLEWERLKPITIAYKERLGISPADQILAMFGVLMQSIDVLSNVGTTREIGVRQDVMNPEYNKFVWEYARFHETGTKNMPPRPLFKLFFKYYSWWVLEQLCNLINKEIGQKVVYP